MTAAILVVVTLHLALSVLAYLFIYGSLRFLARRVHFMYAVTEKNTRI